MRGEIKNKRVKGQLTGIYTRLEMVKDTKFGSEYTWKQVVKDIQKKYGVTIHETTFTRLKERAGRGEPYFLTIDKILAFSDYFEVSTDYIIRGYEPGYKRQRKIEKNYEVIKEKAEKYEKIKRMVLKDNNEGRQELSKEQYPT